MATNKQRFKQLFKTRLPPYKGNRISWRKAIHEELLTASVGINILAEDRLDLTIVLYFDERAVRWHDVDNRLKDIMDALQGRLGGPKAVRPVNPIIPNDNQVYRVLIEKRIAPKQSLMKGHLTLRRYVP